METDGITSKYVSGSQPSLEWIAAPENKSIRYEVDATGVEEWLEWVNESRRVDSGQIELENVGEATAEVVSTLDLYDESTEYNETTGEVEDSVTLTHEMTIEPCETTSAGASADVDFEPDTYNKRSRGRWGVVPRTCMLLTRRTGLNCGSWTRVEKKLYSRVV